MKEDEKVHKIYNENGKLVLALKLCEDTKNIIVLYDDEIADYRFHFRKLKQEREEEICRLRT